MHVLRSGRLLVSTLSFLAVRLCRRVQAPPTAALHVRVPVWPFWQTTTADMRTDARLRFLHVPGVKSWLEARPFRAMTSKSGSGPPSGGDVGNMAQKQLHPCPVRGCRREYEHASVRLPPPTRPASRKPPRPAGSTHLPALRSAAPGASISAHALPAPSFSPRCIPIHPQHQSLRKHLRHDHRGSKAALALPPARKIRKNKPKGASKRAARSPAAAKVRRRETWAVVELSTAFFLTLSSARFQCPPPADAALS